MRTAIKSESTLPVIFLVSLFLVLLNACGFQLKGGANQLSQAGILKPIYPVFEKVSVGFRREFLQTLGAYSQAFDAKSAAVKIVFLKETCQRRSLTVTDTGIPAEYRLVCTVRYQVYENGSAKMREITESRDFKSNNAQLLAVESQQALIKAQIQQRIAGLIIRRFLL